MKTFYVYSHSNPATGVFYVGKGSNERLFKTGNRSKAWKDIVANGGFTAAILEACETEDSAYEREIYWIAFYKQRGECCANVSLGGKGITVAKRWWGDAIGASLRGISRPRGDQNSNFKQGINAEILRELYLDQNLPSTEVAKILGVSVPTVFARLAAFGIPVKPIPRKVIVCVETGVRYESIAAAAQATNLYRENIRKVLAGKYKKTGGLTFKYGE